MFYRMGRLHFKTNVQLKNIIGKDLINNDNIAILELIKNSFDADAKIVDISFLNLKNNDDLSTQSYSDKTSRIIIRDDGVGMDLTDINDKWLNIAYSEKKSKPLQHKRMMAGAKGVGRFSCDRLGMYLNLYAKKSKSKCILLSIDWKKFEIDDETKEIQSIDLEYDELSSADLESRGIVGFEHGVILEIIKLRSKWVYRDSKKWDTDKLSDLRKYLEKLINPNQAFEVNDFGIFLHAPEFEVENSEKNANEKFIGRIENTIFQKLDFKTTSIEFEIIDGGLYTLTSLKDKGDTIYWIKEISEYYPYFKNLKITLYYLNPYAKAFFTKQTGMRSVKYGSVYLFLNGFRIPPYGEEGDDWLKLEQRRTQGYARYISTRDLVGQIEILDEENAFHIVSSREGLVKNDNYDRLTTKNGIFYRVLRRLERYVVEGLNWDSIPESERNKISEIEKKIISGEIKEQHLLFQEDSKTKNKRIYESIHSIVGANPKKTIELYINEKLISQKIEEEKTLAEKEFAQLLEDFDNKKISGDLLSQILKKKATESKELERQLQEFSRYSINDATTKALTELQSFKDIVDKQTGVIASLQSQLREYQRSTARQDEMIRNLQSEKKQAENKIRIVEKEKIEVEQKLAHKAKQVLFLQSVESLDVDRILHYYHDIGVHASTIQNRIDRLTKKRALGTTTDGDIAKFLEVVSKVNKKILTISRFATKANFNTTGDILESDIVGYIVQYTSEILTEVYSDIKFHYEGDENQYIIKFKPLELSLMLDNIVLNSHIAGAHNVMLTFARFDNSLLISICDDGKGLSKLIDNPNSVFEKGFTTTSGSGLGLYNISQLIKEMNGEISIDPDYSGGFKLIIKL